MGLLGIRTHRCHSITYNPRLDMSIVLNEPVGHVYPRPALPPVFNEHKICSFDSGDGRMDEFHADSYIP